jgi:crotonobetainyl-CoA:carnitine CoA-transferase CaiB-like acyl-CoA transferase
MRRLDELRIAYGSINDMQDVAEHPVVAERAMLGRFETSSGFRATSLTGIGERLFGTPADGRERPPDVGEDTEEILDMLGLSVEYEQAGEPPP